MDELPIDTKTGVPNPRKDLSEIIALNINSPFAIFFKELDLLPLINVFIGHVIVEALQILNQSTIGIEDQGHEWFKKIEELRKTIDV
ncbi:hypothetical protein J6590_088296 [Homalodisca vitripennis]|nr:hypothetical protein J6590_088296 [Homalodisca vitripennis]